MLLGILRITFILIALSTTSNAQVNFSLGGRVYDMHHNHSLLFASIQLKNKQSKKYYSAITDDKGNYYIPHIKAGEYDLYTHYLGYEKNQTSISITQNKTYDIKLTPLLLDLDEVIVTASESKGLTSASKIDSTAMRHLQPSSFTDILELLPGGKSSDPNMGSVNLIKLREAGTSDMSSLGVGFMIDGVPISNDANLQMINGTGNLGNGREIISKGIDMRTISTDNIESVEIIRGIPSAEYGDLTNGLVIINRKSRATPYTARFKADQYSKLLSIGKGLRIGRNNDIINLDLSYLDSKIDPRNSFENYKRITASARWHGNREIEKGAMKWNINADYTGSFDDVKVDKDITVRDDSYQSSYDRIGMSGSWDLNFNNNSWVRTIRTNVSASQEFSKIDQTKNVSLNRPTAIPSTAMSGEADGIYLPYTYRSNMLVDGKPLYLNARLLSESNFNWGASNHHIKMGLDWTYHKNFGQGEIYDLKRPLNTSTVTRPRDFSTIPSSQRASFFIEERMSLHLAGHQLSTSLGIRATTALNLANQFAIKGKLFLDPRLNAMWTFPLLNDWRFDISGGIGYLSKMPTTAQLYPIDKYVDITQINYYHNNPDFRIINFMTYQWDNTNYDLSPARNRKWEFRLGISKNGNNLSLTYFNETMKNGFNTNSYYRSLGYKKYDIHTIDESTLNGPPNLAEISYEQNARINSYTQMGNSANTYKKGIEFQFSSKRIEALKTRISFNGAWFHTKYSTESTQYKEKNILLNNNQLEYVGVYQWEDGNVYQQFNTNAIFDTYLEHIGLIFSLSAQCAWFKNNRPLWNDGSPTNYVDKWGTVHPFTEKDKEDMVLQHLVNIYSDAYFDLKTTPFAMDLNLKATKEIGKYINLSLFVNRFLSLYPDYYDGDKLVRRTSSPYFGMEANLFF